MNWDWVLASRSTESEYYRYAQLDIGLVVLLLPTPFHLYILISYISPTFNPSINTNPRLI